MPQIGPDWYKGSSKRTRVVISCATCGKVHWAFKGNKYCNNTCAGKARIGTANSNFLSKPQHSLSLNEYKRLHANLAKERGKASSCVNGCVASRYEWANQTGDYYNFDDYVSMCCSCRHKLDLQKERSV